MILNLKKTNINKKIKPNLVSGFTILFAVLVSSIVLALGLGIVAITMKEVQLSGAGRDSQLSFYAADSGAECGFYWDLKGENFATSSVGGISVNNLSSMTCAGGENLNQDKPSDISGIAKGVDSGSGSLDATTTFWIYMATTNGNVGDPSKPCAQVQVGKHADSVGGQIRTIIDSRGYNTCADNPRRLERGYQIQY
ncbi:MAG: hypothetical protein WCO12_01550 [bacterium]